MYVVLSQYRTLLVLQVQDEGAALKGLPVTSCSDLRGAEVVTPAVRSFGGTHCSSFLPSSLLTPTVSHGVSSRGAARRASYKECRAWLPILVPPFLGMPSSRPIPPRPPARCDRVPSQGLSPVSTAPGTNLARRATPRLAPASLKTYAASDRSRTDRQPPLPPAGNLSGGGRGEPSRASPGPQ